MAVGDSPRTPSVSDAGSPWSTDANLSTVAPPPGFTPQPFAPPPISSYPISLSHLGLTLLEILFPSSSSLHLGPIPHRCRSSLSLAVSSCHRHRGGCRCSLVPHSVLACPHPLHAEWIAWRHVEFGSLASQVTVHQPESMDQYQSLHDHCSQTCW